MVVRCALTQGRDFKAVIYVSKEQLDQVEYLIHQSIQGNHILFDSESVRKAFWATSASLGKGAQGSEKNKVESLIENLISQPTIQKKRAFLERLDANTYESVIRTYFNIVENNLFESKKVLH